MSRQPASVNGLRLRAALGRTVWLPPRRYGTDGWLLDRRDGTGRAIVTAWTEDDGSDWAHASISRVGQLPTWPELGALHRAVWGTTGWAYQVFAPADQHVNIAEYALHLWGRLDGQRLLPDFGAAGTI
jgi:hypothetical protein